MFGPVTSRNLAGCWCSCPMSTSFAINELPLPGFMPLILALSYRVGCTPYRRSSMARLPLDSKETKVGRTQPACLELTIARDNKQSSSAIASTAPLHVLLCFENAANTCRAVSFSISSLSDVARSCFSANFCDSGVQYRFAIFVEDFKLQF